MAKKDISRREYIQRQERLQDRKERFYMDNRAQREKEKAEREKEKKEREAVRRREENTRKIAFISFGNIFTLLIVILLIANIFSYFTGTSPKTFAGFLEFMSTAPDISTDWLNWGFISLGDWGVFNFLKELIEYAIEILNVSLFVCTALVNAIIFIIWFVGWLYFGI